MESTIIEEPKKALIELDHKEEMKEEADVYVEEAEKAAIVDQAGYLTIGNRRKALYDFVKKTEASCRPRIKQAHDLHKSLKADMDAIINPVKQAIKKYDALLTAWDTRVREEEERKRKEEEKLERERQAAQKQLDEEKRLEEAAKLEEMGDKEGAERVLNAVPEPVVPKVIKEEKVEKPTGVSYQTRWKWKRDEAIPIEQCDGRFLRMVPDKDMLDAYAKSSKETAKANGFIFYADKTVVSK